MPAPRPDSEDLTVKTGGRTLGGWTRIRVTRSVELLPSHFELELTERYPAQFDQSIVDPTAPCEVYLGGDLVITGYIDRYQPVYDKGSHHVRLIGRSKTEDVVDCAVDVTKTGWQIKAKTIGEAARIICDPYGITISLPDGDTDFPADAQSSYFAIYPGFTCYQLIEEMARAVGMLVWDNEKGELVISKGGTGGRAGSGLVEGSNAEIVEGNLTADQRFARYIVVGQGPDQTNGHINPSGSPAYDPEKDKLRNRLRIIPFEIPDITGEFSTRRAQWEANRRYGRSKLARITVTGWRDGNGKLWQPNTIANVDLPTAKVQEDRVICEVTWQRGESGTQSVITVMPAGALSPQPFAPIPVVPQRN